MMAKTPTAPPKYPKPGDPGYRTWLLQQKRRKRKQNNEAE